MATNLQVVSFFDLDIGERYRYAVAVHLGLNEVRIKESETHYRAITPFGPSDSFEVADIGAEVTAASSEDMELFVAKYSDTIRSYSPDVAPAIPRQRKAKGMRNG